MQRPINKRRTFTVKEQLISKMGPKGYGALLDQLHRSATKPKRRPGPRRPEPKAVA